jgi:hypothetical protein
MRCVGSHNSKYGEPIEVTVARAGEPVDLVDVEALLDLYSGPLFTTREDYLPKDNVVSLDVPYTPAVLADMPTTGEGINGVQHKLLRALIVRDGKTPEEALDIVVDATMEMAARSQPEWTREIEIKCATSRLKWVLDCLQKQHWKAVSDGNVAHDTPPDWLPGEWQEPWLAGCAGGARPNISRNLGGFYVRRQRIDTQVEPPIHTNGSGAPPIGRVEADARPSTAEAPPARSGSDSGYTTSRTWSRMTCPTT